MKKRSKYRPKGVRLDVMQWLKEGMKPMVSHPAAIDLRIKNHAALASIVHGSGTRQDIDVLIAALNITEALAMKGLGQDWRAEIKAGQDAIFNMTKRGLRMADKFIFTGPEMTAVNLAMEVHDAQIDQCTVAELERALDIVQQEIRNKKAREIAA